MADGFAVGNRGVATLHGAWLVGDRAGSLTVGAGLRGGQGLSLLLQQGIEGSLGQAARRGAGDLFEGREVHRESWSGVPKGASRDDFAPLGRDFTDLPELFRC